MREHSWTMGTSHAQAPVVSQLQYSAGRLCAMSSVRTNLAATQALYILRTTSQALDETLRRLNTGRRINSAHDGSSMWSISQDLNRKRTDWEVVESTLKLGSASVNAALSSVNEIVSGLSTIKEKLIVYSGLTGSQQKSALQREIESIIDRNDSRATSSSVNGTNLITKTSRANSGAPSSGVGMPVDYVFCIDISGSMGGYLDAVRNNVDDFINSRAAAGENARFSFTTYSDVVTLGATEPLSSSGFYTDPDAFEAALDGVHLLGGGDTPESGLEALQQIRALPFRPGAFREVVMITDATVHSLEDGTGSLNTVEGTIADLSADGIRVTIAGPDAPDPRLLSISAGTGGSYHGINDPSFFSSGFGVPPVSSTAEPFRVLSSPEGNMINVRYRSMLAKDLGIDPLNFESPGSGLAQIERALAIAVDHAVHLGVSQRAMVDAGEVAERFGMLYSSSIGALIDTDLEVESIRLSALRAQEQLAVQSLAIANETPKRLIQLFS